MENTTFYQNYFAELEKCKIDVENFTFNDFTTDEIPEYRIKLNNSYKSFENELDNIIQSSTIDIKQILNILKTRIDLIKEDFEKRKTNFLNTYKFTNSKFYINASSKNLINIEYLKNPQFQLLENAIAFQLSIIDKTIDCIKKRITTITLNEEIAPASNVEFIEHISKKTAQLKEQHTTKLLLNMSKKEIALMFMLFVENDIIKPETITQLYEFIQNNFKYIDNSKGKKQTKNITDINIAFSRLTNEQENKANENFRKKTIEKLSNKIDANFDKFLTTKLADFRNKF